MNNRGFTLVELIVGIVVLAIAMMIMNTMLVAQSKYALEPLYRLRASQLGQGIMQNVLSRAYDENSDHNGGLYRCGELWLSDNAIHSCSASLGTDGSEVADEHEKFNDVDDFITNGFQSAVNYGDVLGTDLPNQYNNYAINIEVVAFSSHSKKIAITIKTPSNEEIRFSALKGNY
jgi:MSHA pilin protein MshD